MSRLADYLRNYRNRRHVRPWALFTPILILVICLPLLRPLRHPAPAQTSDVELACLATVESLVERNTFAINDASIVPARQATQVQGFRYADQPPMFATLLAGPYWVMHRLGMSFTSSAPAVSYVLTLLGVTLPVAASAGLIYRMGRLFELRRPWRMLLAIGVVFGSGLISYATVLNPHAPAAALVLSAAGCLVHIAIHPRPVRTHLWTFVAGAAVALAATLVPIALLFAPLLAMVIVTLPVGIWKKLAMLLTYAVGTVGPLLLHLHLTSMSVGIVSSWMASAPEAPGTVTRPVEDFEADGDERSLLSSALLRLGSAMVGSHGLVSHFPILLLGAAGVFMVMHRHWPAVAKALAAVALVGALVVIVGQVLSQPRWPDPAFAARWFVVASPLLLFWAGAWLRRPHRALAWTVAGVALTFSMLVGLAGATNPQPRDGYHTYSALAAVRGLFTSAPLTPTDDTSLAGGDVR